MIKKFKLLSNKEIQLPWKLKLLPSTLLKLDSATSSPSQPPLSAENVDEDVIWRHVADEGIPWMFGDFQTFPE